MTAIEFFRIFGRTVVDSRELACADSTECLALVTYLAGLERRRPGEGEGLTSED